MSAPVNLPGWDASRTDDDPKYVFGRYVQNLQQQGKPYNADAVRQFVAQDPRWELLNGSSADPLLRVKQGELDKWKPGASIWQDVIGDAGGQNRPQFMNVTGDPSQGFAAAQAPTAQAPYASRPMPLSGFLPTGDQSTAGLDAGTAAQLMELLKKIQLGSAYQLKDQGGQTQVNPLIQSYIDAITAASGVK